jgi:hypothetical protein
MTILNHKLHRIIPRLHICHLALETVITHDGRSKDDSDILRGHQIRRHLRDHAGEMEDQELQDVAVDLWQSVERLAQMCAALLFIFDCCDLLAPPWDG